MFPVLSTFYICVKNMEYFLCFCKYIIHMNAGDEHSVFLYESYSKLLNYKSIIKRIKSLHTNS